MAAPSQRTLLSNFLLMKQLHCGFNFTHFTQAIPARRLNVGRADVEYSELERLAQFPMEGRIADEKRKRWLATRLKKSATEVPIETISCEINTRSWLKFIERFSQDFINKYDAAFKELGVLTKSTAVALKRNAQIDAHVETKGMKTPEYVDVSVTLATRRGRVRRNVEFLHSPQIRIALAVLLAEAYRGCYGQSPFKGDSLMSTAFFSRPKNTTLGIHGFPICAMSGHYPSGALPKMNISLTYDKRLTTEKDAVEFLRKAKDTIEGRQNMQNPFKTVTQQQ